MTADRKTTKKEQPEQKRKRLLDQMDDWVHEIDEVLEAEPAILKPS